MKESFGINVPAFRTSILFASGDHALARVAVSRRRFAPLSCTHSWNRNPAGHFKTSLEAAAQQLPRA